MTHQPGDKVHINGIVTFMRPGVWRRGGILEANHVTLMRERHNGMWEVSIPDLGLCLIHRTAIVTTPNPTWIRPEFQAKSSKS